MKIETIVTNIEFEHKDIDTISDMIEIVNNIANYINKDEWNDIPDDFANFTRSFIKHISTYGDTYSEDWKNFSNYLEEMKMFIKKQIEAD